MMVIKNCTNYGNLQVHVVDGSSEQPDLEFDAVRLELEMFSPELAEKPYIVAYNKMDFLEAYERWPLFKQRLEARGICTFCMSAVNREGTPQVISTAHEILQKCKAERDIEGRILSSLFFTIINVTVLSSYLLDADK